MITFTIPGEATPYAKRRFIPKRQENFMGAVRTFASKAMAGKEPLRGPIAVLIDTFWLHPASWSQKRKAATPYKISKPDASNCAKLLEDSLKKIVWADDSQVVDLRVRKFYSMRAEVIVSITPLDQQS